MQYISLFEQLVLDCIVVSVVHVHQHAFIAVTSAAYPITLHRILALVTTATLLILSACNEWLRTVTVTHQLPDRLVSDMKWVAIEQLYKNFF